MICYHTARTPRIDHMQCIITLAARAPIPTCYPKFPCTFVHIHSSPSRRVVNDRRVRSHILCRPICRQNFGHECRHFPLACQGLRRDESKPASVWLPIVWSSQGSNRRSRPKLRRRTLLQPPFRCGIKVSEETHCVIGTASRSCHCRQNLTCRPILRALSSTNTIREGACHEAEYFSILCIGFFLPKFQTAAELYQVICTAAQQGGEHPEV